MRQDTEKGQGVGEERDGHCGWKEGNGKEEDGR